MAQIYVARFKYLKHGIGMLEMIKEFDKRIIYVGNYVYIWELA